MKCTDICISLLRFCDCIIQILCVAVEPVLELALVDQAGFKLTEILLLLPPECWD
ncbi:hypothetical protein I79_001264 [Cricetulus griseus]|uniref:Uncharacterized protein n=1 Tax=Cricetulus griseus TaxID=10029 RepID=G3GUB0_CRIGR|nr:hypothetical protein I79_001264 [Cricetulus griseus]